MTAKEMFEALGYEVTRNNKQVLTYEKDIIVIAFYKMFGAEHYAVFRYRLGHIYRHCISVKEHQAIHQQLKELGWIE